MKKIKHIRLAGFLMALSWVLLFVFVVQWVVARYFSEKDILREDLGRQFAEVNVQVQDTTLMVNLIDPMMKTSQKAHIARFATDSIVLINRKEPQHTSADKSNGLPSNKKAIYRISVSDSDSAQVSSHVTHKPYTDSGNIFLHSIRLIVGKAIDSTDSPAVLNEFISFKIDTILFRKFFSRKLKNQGLDFKFTMYSGKDIDSSLRKSSKLYLSSPIFNSSVGAVINNFSWYLFKRIIPQVLFAILLLLITGAAFIFMYRTLKKQVMLNTLRNDFIGNITHELKTPVSTIKVALESLRNFDMKKDPAIASEYLNMAFLEMDRLDQLIDKVLNISVLEEQSHMIKLHTSDLKQVVSKVVVAVVPRIAQDQGEILLEADDENYICPVDELFIEGVLMNLIDNSIKYSGGNPWILARLEQDAKQVILSITDRGPGIPEQYLQKVFDKFFRIPTGERHDVKGHGLGLSYAAAVMRQHRGSITVSNNEDGGCTFTLRFPKE